MQRNIISRHQNICCVLVLFFSFFQLAFCKGLNGATHHSSWTSVWTHFFTEHLNVAGLIVFPLAVVFWFLYYMETHPKVVAHIFRRFSPLSTNLTLLRRNPKAKLFGLICGYVGTAAAAFSWIFIIPSWEESTNLHWTKSTTACVVILSQLAFILGESFFGSSIPQRYGGHRPLLIQMGVIILLMVALAFTRYAWQISYVVTFLGMFHGTMYVLFTYMAETSLPPRYFHSALLLLGLSAELGEVGSSWIVGELLGAFSWHFCCFVVAFFCICCFTIYYTLVPNETSQEYKSKDEEDPRSIIQKVDGHGNGHSVGGDVAKTFIKVIRSQDGRLVLLQLSMARIGEVYPVYLTATFSAYMKVKPAVAALAATCLCVGATISLFLSSILAMYIKKSTMRMLNVLMISLAAVGHFYLAFRFKSPEDIYFWNILIGAGSAIPLYSPYSDFQNMDNDKQQDTSSKIAIAGAISTMVGMLGVTVVSYIYAEWSPHQAWLSVTVMPGTALAVCSLALIRSELTQRRRKSVGL